MEGTIKDAGLTKGKIDEVSAVQLRCLYLACQLASLPACDVMIRIVVLVQIVLVGGSTRIIKFVSSSSQAADQLMKRVQDSAADSTILWRQRAQ